MKKAHPAIKYHLKQIIVSAITYTTALVCLYFLDTQTGISTWAVVAIGVVIVAVPWLAFELGDLNRPSPRCDVEAPAKLLGTGVAYEYQGKTYKKTIRVHSVQGKPRYPFTVRICSKHPRRCYIVLEK